MQIKISAKLNNCALHCLVPEIKTKVISISKNCDASQYYDLLKKIFAEFYTINDLSWSEFAELLEKFNAHDLQIVLGPVLRQFMNNMIRTKQLISSKCNNPIELSNNLCQLSKSNGRYESLEIINLIDYIEPYLQLGIWENIKFYHFGGDGAENGGHWERCENPNEFIVSSDFQDIVDLLNDDPHIVNAGFILLKQYVNATYNNNIELQNTSKQKANDILQTYNDNASMITSSLHKKINELSPVELPNNLAQEFAEKYLNELYERAIIKTIEFTHENEKTHVNSRWLILQVLTFLATIILITLTALSIVGLIPGAAASVATFGLFVYAGEKNRKETARVYAL